MFCSSKIIYLTHIFHSIVVSYLDCISNCIAVFTKAGLKKLLPLTAGTETGKFWQLTCLIVETKSVTRSMLSGTVVSLYSLLQIEAHY